MIDLSAMQAAYRAGRQSSGIASHLYVELQGCGLDPQRLAAGVEALFRRHPMLRGRVTPGGRLMVGPHDPELHRLWVDDLRGMTLPDLEDALDRVRDRMTHQTLPMDKGCGAEFRLSLLPDRAHRLHVDLDMIAADPSCLGQLLEDLADLTEGRDCSHSPLQPCYLDVVRPVPSAAVDRDWWRETVRALPPALAMPSASDINGQRPRSTALSQRFGPEVREQLAGRARQAGVTPSIMAVAIAAQVLAEATGQDDFRLTMPTFLRPAGNPHGFKLVGDFSSMILIAVRNARIVETAALARDLAAQVAAALSHPGGSAIEALRELSRERGGLEPSPLVLTAGFGLAHGSIIGPHARAVLGDLIWSVSQGAGVALDIQLAEEGDGLWLNWDLRLDLLDAEWTAAAFARHAAALAGLTAAGRTEERPLSSLHRAYLLGRGDTLPLGGVAMQEFRAYRGTTPPEALAERMAGLMRAHPALRRRVDVVTETSWRDDAADPPIEIVDLAALSPAAAEARVADDALDLSQNSGSFDHLPWRVRLFRMPAGCDDPTVLHVRFDALILDGFGISRVLAELLGDGPILPDASEPPSSATGNRAADEAWWRSRLARLPAPPDLPWLTDLSSVARSPWARQQVGVEAAALAALRRLAARSGLMLNSLLSTVLLDTLARWTPGQPSCVAMPVATPAGGRLGNVSTFIVVDHDPGAGMLVERAGALQVAVAAGLSHLSFSGVDLARAMLATRPAGRISLPVVLTNGLGWDATPVGPMRQTGGLTQTPQVALDIRLTPDGSGGFCIALDHATAALDPETVRAIAETMRDALKALADRPVLPEHLAVPLPALALPAVVAPQPPTPIAFLRRIAERLHRDNADPAVVQNGIATSYADLGRRVSSLIAGLRARGVTAGDVLAICLPRGPDHLALQLAAAFEGVVWAPLDHGSPPDRLRHMLDTCRPALVAADPERVPGAVASDALAGDADTVRLDPVVLQERSLSEGAAFFLFTSGTTGRPKCVVLSHAAAANTLGATIARWGVNAGDRVMSVTPLHHDMAVFDLMGSLSCGAAVVMPDSGADKDAQGWSRLVAAHRVSVWVSVPAILEMLLACAEDRQLASLRIIAQGGDYIRPATITALQQRTPSARLVSLGGPTETTIWSIWHDIGPGDTGPVPYGQPLPGNIYHILDAAGQPCPLRVTGRIHSSGSNLALGYLQDGELSQQDFVLLPGIGRCFRSGDLGRWRADGTIMFAGRVDGYVKIRGVRVSLPEIADELACHPQIGAVLVVDLPDPATGETVLGAIYSGPSALTPATLRGFVRERLPAAHQPSRLLRVEALPLSANGKPDRTAARALLADRHVPVEVGAVCAAMLGLAPDAVADDSILVDLGLLPRHLPAIARMIDPSGGLDPALLLGCRTPADITHITKAQS